MAKQTRTYKKLPELTTALIKRLPAAGEPFPIEQRRAWLEFAQKAFDVDYGVTATEVQKPAPKMQAVQQNTTYECIIDKEGYARNEKGNRILPDEVKGDVFDMRGQNSDVRTIIWADDSEGVNGRNLSIQVA